MRLMDREDNALEDFQDVGRKIARIGVVESIPSRPRPDLRVFRVFTLDLQRLGNTIVNKVTARLYSRHEFGAEGNERVFPEATGSEEGGVDIHPKRTVVALGPRILSVILQGWPEARGVHSLRRVE